MKKSLADRITEGDVTAAARLISAVEKGEAAASAEIKKLAGHLSHSYVIGITGPPGAGKSTLIGRLASAFRERGLSIGIIAADPVSPSSCGAILGDRVRMLPWCDDGVFLRSLTASSGYGALAEATPDVIRIMAALGRDIIILETLGSGQGDIGVASLSNVCLLVLNPGSGDDIQMLKAGILEVADILVINKADKDGAAELKKGLEFMLETRASKIKSPVVLTQAIYGEGIAELTAEILERRQTAGVKPAVRGKK